MQIIVSYRLLSNKDNVNQGTGRPRGAGAYLAFNAQFHQCQTLRLLPLRTTANRKPERLGLPPVAGCNHTIL
jgi:hypothetical protein